jgi:hypothetical protein
MVDNAANQGNRRRGDVGDGSKITGSLFVQRGEPGNDVLAMVKKSFSTSASRRFLATFELPSSADASIYRT